jgi:hypothetical protein
LMPRSSVLAAELQHATVDRILKCKARWKVSATALTHRLRELDLLTEWEYSNRIVTLSRLGYRSSEPGGIPRETSLLLAKTLGALRGEGLSATALARRLDLSTEDLNAYLFGLVPLVIDGAGETAPSPRPHLTLHRGNHSKVDLR